MALVAPAYPRGAQKAFHSPHSWSSEAREDAAVLRKWQGRLGILMGPLFGGGLFHAARAGGYDPA